MKQIRDALMTVADTVGKHKGHIVARRGFFFKHGMTSEKFAARVNAALEKAGCAERVQEHGEKWVAFRGGQTVAQGSHFWVKLG
jgi:hypothetical protein